MRDDRGLLLDAALIAAVHALACLLVRAAGFDHVSDDDFARVTIAQSFAVTPTLDPSGTSWLPLPFWVTGSSMAVFGRSLSVARAVSVLVASVAAATPYLALRSTGRARGPALASVAFGVLSPWSLWLGAATVPESMTASFTAAGAIALGARGASQAPARSSPWFAAALFAACLSRYDAWPVAATIAIALVVSSARARDREESRRHLVHASIVALGPVAWMAWNLHAHGSLLHFFHRVSTFRRAHADGAQTTLTALLAVPRMLVASRPDVCLGALGAVVVLRRPEARARWAVPLLSAVALVAFLSYGNLKDGAPTHHAARALLGGIFLVAAFAAEAVADAMLRLRAERGGTKRTALGGAVLVAAWLFTCRSTWPEMPGHSAADDRSAQLAAGATLRATLTNERVVLTPCAYEHFALIAAFGAPERVVIRTASTSDLPKVAAGATEPSSANGASAPCPRVVVE